MGLPSGNENRIPRNQTRPGALGGRLDHILSNLGCLYRYRHLQLVLVGDGNLTHLVPAGRALLRPAPGAEGPSCGLVPLAGTATASSTGLRWNLGARGAGCCLGVGVRGQGFGGLVQQDGWILTAVILGVVLLSRPITLSAETSKGNAPSSMSCRPHDDGDGRAHQHQQCSGGRLRGGGLGRRPPMDHRVPVLGHEMVYLSVPPCFTHPPPC